MLVILSLFFSVGAAQKIPIHVSDYVMYASPNYPQPYPPLSRVKGGDVAQEFTVDAGFGLAFLFHRFSLADSDCLSFCTLAQTSCPEKCGSEMDHRGNREFLVTTGNTTVDFYRNSNDPAQFHHAGFYVKVMKYDLNARATSLCNQSVTLSLGDDPFFLVSQNYPNASSLRSACKLDISSSVGVRVAFYDFQSHEGTDQFSITSGNSVDHFKGKYVTYDESFAMYYEGDISIQYQINAQIAAYPTRFFIFIDTYEIAIPTNGCDNTGTYDMNGLVFTMIGTKGFGERNYDNNLNCEWLFNNVPEGHRIAMEITYESEHCCDIMNITGIDPPPYDLWTYQGNQGYNLLFAEQSFLHLNFSSDGVEGDVGFQANITAYDCTCFHGPIALAAQESRCDAVAAMFCFMNPCYCPLLNCSWELAFPADSLLSIQPIVVDLRSTYGNYETVNVTDAFLRGLITYTAYSSTEWVAGSGGTSFITFKSSGKAQFDPTALKRGFQLQISTHPMNISSNTVQLDDSNFLTDLYAEVQVGETRQFVIKPRAGRRITLYRLSEGYASLLIDLRRETEWIDPSPFYSPLRAGVADSLSLDPDQTLTLRVTPTIKAFRFAAVATDLVDDEYEAACGSLVWTTGAFSAQATAKVDLRVGKGGHCYKVLNTVPSAWNSLTPQLGITTIFDGTGEVNYYKGLSTHDQNLLATSSAYPLPEYTSGPFVVLSFKQTTAPQAVHIAPRNRTMYYHESINGSNRYLVSSPDLGTSPAAIKQRIEIELLGLGSEVAGIHLEILRPLESAELSILPELYDHIGETKKYTSANGVLSMDICATKLILGYASDGKAESGLLARFWRSDQHPCHPKSTVVHFSASVIMVFLVLVL